MRNRRPRGFSGTAPAGFARWNAALLTLAGLMAMALAWACGCSTAADSSESAAAVRVLGSEKNRVVQRGPIEVHEDGGGYGGFTCLPTPGVTGPTEHAGDGHAA